MALTIDGYPDPDDAPGATIDGVYVWIPEVRLDYALGSARFVVWVHQSTEAAATWPEGARVPPIATLAVTCGARVPGMPDSRFPTVEALLARAATIAGTMMAAVAEGTTEEQAAVLASIAAGGAIRSALYAYLVELIYLTATEAE
jgi:hypothetical protein